MAREFGALRWHTCAAGAFLVLFLGMCAGDYRPGGEAGVNICSPEERSPTKRVSCKADDLCQHESACGCIPKAYGIA
ncbi:hypothetical protein T484DRAFT_1801971 [Baffinella frigidus]|nr:hypothetical protein T484DRAFT_1801971 [Cryptophyta sp. CCMP2293]